MEKSNFFDKVYQAVCKIPRGNVATYGQIALLCGNPRASRAVGWALHKNPSPGEIPCHRVVNCEGRLATEFAFGGSQAQRKLLEAENVPFLPNGNVDIKKAIWCGDYK